MQIDEGITTYAHGFSELTGMWMLVPLGRRGSLLKAKSERIQLLSSTRYLE